MGNKDKTKLNQNIQSERDRSLGQMNQFYGQLQSERPAIQAQDQAERQGILDRANSQFTGASSISQEDRDYLRSRSVYKPIAGTYGGGEAPEPGGDGGGGGGGGGDIGGAAAPTGPALFSRSDAGYEEFANTGGVNVGALKEALGGFRELSDKSGGFDPQRLANIEGAGRGYQGIADTGGFTPEGLGRLRQGVEDIRGFGQTGGFAPEKLAALRGIQNKMETIGHEQMTPEDIAQFRGTGFKEFAETGGYSPEQVRMMRARSNAAIPAAYNAEMQNLEARRNVQGGYSPGADALRGRLLRQKGQDIASAARDTELGISDAVRQGRQYGISGQAAQEIALQNALDANRKTRESAFSDALKGGTELENQVAQNKFAGITGAQTAEQGLEQQLVANRLAGLGGVKDTNLDLQNAINSTRVQGLQGIQKTQQESEALIQGGRLAGLAGMMQTDKAKQDAIDAANAAAASRYAADAAAGASRYASDQHAAEYDANMAFKYAQLGSENELNVQGLLQKDRLAGMGSAQDLYGQVGGQASQNDKMRLEAAGLTGSQQQGLLGQQYQAAQLPGAWDRVMGIANAGIGAAGAYFNPTNQRRPNQTNQNTGIYGGQWIPGTSGITM